MLPGVSVPRNIFGYSSRFLSTRCTIVCSRPTRELPVIHTALRRRTLQPVSMLCSVAGAAVVGLLAIVAAVVVYRKVGSGSGGPKYKRCAVGMKSIN